MLFHNQPQRGFEGKFSMPFVVAMALIEGKVGLDSFTDQNAKDPRVIKLIAKTRFYVEPDFSSCSIDEAPALVTVHLKNGTVMRKKIEDPLGSPTNPMSERRLFEKFRECTRRVLPKEKVDRSLAILLELENLNTLGELIYNLVP
jgi:2-methylcitrate dehydratase PrpD